MPSSYPGALDDLDETTNPTLDHGDVAAAVEAVQSELGTDPSDGSTTVKARIDAEGIRGLFSVFAPSGALFENVPRIWNVSQSQNGPASGTMGMTPIWLPAGITITSITLVSGATGATSPTNQWFALYNSSRTLLRQTVNDGTTAWGATTAKTLALTSTFATTYTGLHYVGWLVTAGAVPTIVFAVNSASGTVRQLAPVHWGTSSTGLTTTAPATAAAITGSGNPAYCYVS